MIDLNDKKRLPSTEAEVPNEDSATRSAGQLSEQAGERVTPSIGVDSIARTGADLSLDPPSITTLEQAKASLNAMDTLNSISNKPWLKTMALIDSINNPPWKKAMAIIQAIENPPWKQAMAAFETMENPPWRQALAAVDSIENQPWRQAIAAIDSIENPTWKQALAAVESINNPSWKQTMAVIESVENPPWKQALAAVDSINNPSWIKAMEAIESAQNPPWKQAIETALQSVNNPGLRAARAALDSLKVSSWRNALAELDAITSSSALRMAAVAIESWGDLHSPLLGYLASDEARDLTAILGEVALQNPESFLSSDTIEHSDLPALERQIVGLLDSGDAIEQLPATARSHLLQYAIYLCHFAKVIMYLIAVWQAVDFVQGKLSSAKSSADVKGSIAQIPQEQASLLSGHRVLIRDKVNLRTQPSEKSEIKALPKIGAVLEVLEDGEVWIRVSIDVSGEIVEGWIARRYTVALGIPKQQ